MGFEIKFTCDNCGKEGAPPPPENMTNAMATMMVQPKGWFATSVGEDFKFACCEKCRDEFDEKVKAGIQSKVAALKEDGAEKQIIICVPWNEAAHGEKGIKGRKADCDICKCKVCVDPRNKTDGWTIICMECAIRSGVKPGDVAGAMVGGQMYDKAMFDEIGVRYFGVKFGGLADMPDNVVIKQVPVPVGTKCDHCDEVFVEGDNGVDIPAVQVGGGIKRAYYHTECFTVQHAGGLAHVSGVCVCNGHTRAEAKAVTKGMSKREEAIKVFDIVYWKKKPEAVDAIN